MKLVSCQSECGATFLQTGLNGFHYCEGTAHCSTLMLKLIIKAGTF
jgi:hypothetical protein